jgi:catechol 2,3-dioxygenase-like lactoylglutathione lyase family enzyme
MRIDHIAHPSHDPYETHRFYNGVLGLELVQAYAGRELLLVYALPEGGSLAFSCSRDGPPSTVGNVSWERRHVGLTVAARADFDRWLHRLKEFGIRHELVENERIYFADPDGLVLELEVATLTPPNPAAGEVLAAWRRG